MSDLDRELHQFKHCAGFDPKTHKEGEVTVLRVWVHWRHVEHRFDSEGRRTL